MLFPDAGVEHVHVDPESVRALGGLVQAIERVRTGLRPLRGSRALVFATAEQLRLGHPVEIPQSVARGVAPEALPRALDAPVWRVGSGGEELIAAGSAHRSPRRGGDRRLGEDGRVSAHLLSDRPAPFVGYRRQRHARVSIVVYSDALFGARHSRGKQAAVGSLEPQRQSLRFYLAWREGRFPGTTWHVAERRACGSPRRSEGAVAVGALAVARIARARAPRNYAHVPEHAHAAPPPFALGVRAYGFDERVVVRQCSHRVRRHFGEESPAQHAVGGRREQVRRALRRSVLVLQGCRSRFRSGRRGRGRTSHAGAVGGSIRSDTIAVAENKEYQR